MCIGQLIHTFPQIMAFMVFIACCKWSNILNQWRHDSQSLSCEWQTLLHHVCHVNDKRALFTLATTTDRVILYIKALLHIKFRRRASHIGSKCYVFVSSFVSGPIFEVDMCLCFPFNCKDKSTTNNGWMHWHANKTSQWTGRTYSWLQIKQLRLRNSQLKFHP